MVRSKAVAAFERIGGPVLVEDTGYEFDIVMQVYDGLTGELLYSDNFKDFKEYEGESSDPLVGMFQNLYSMEDRIIGIFAQKERIG